MRSDGWLFFGFYIVLALALVCYWPGVQGGFLFDDYPNLDDLGAYGGVVDWETFRSFVSNGFAGPTGRPLALATFLLNDNAWPSNAYAFKMTNILVHLLCGVVLFASTRLLARYYGKNSTQSDWIALIAASIWILHPYMVSTTLYIVQRMAQLSTLFVLIGIWGYLVGRMRLRTDPNYAYLMMSVSLVGATAAAVLCKENGALLPLLVLVVEFCRPPNEYWVKLNRYWAVMFVWIPTLAVVGYLASLVNVFGLHWENRNFSQYERVLTEARVLCEYYYDLWLPKIEGKGLFQDDYVISRSLLEPASTLFSVLLVAASAFFAAFFKRRWPFFSLSVLFFLCSHLIESSVVNLEIYFEHRNYQAAVFLFLPLASGLVWLAHKLRRRVVISIVSMLMLMLSAMTYERSSLWSSSKELELYWAANAPNSARAQSVIASALAASGRDQDASQHLESAMGRLPESALLSVTWLIQKVGSGVAKADDFERAGQALATQPFDAQAVTGLRQLTEMVVASRVEEYAKGALKMFSLLERSVVYGEKPLFLRLMPYLKAKLYLAYGQPEQAYVCYSQAMRLYADTDAALMMMAEMSSRPSYAYALLFGVRETLEHQKPSTLKRSDRVYREEIQRLAYQLVADGAKPEESLLVRNNLKRQECP